MQQHSRKQGFTLLEIVLVIGVIILLMSVVLASTASARAKSRDAQRVADLSQAAIAIEQYRQAHGSYPTLTHTDTSPQRTHILGTRIAHAVAMVSEPQSCSFEIEDPSDPYTPLCPSYNYPDVTAFGGFLKERPIDPINDSEHFYRFVVDDPNDIQAFCLIANKLETQDNSYYVTKLGGAYGLSGIETCPGM